MALLSREAVLLLEQMPGTGWAPRSCQGDGGHLHQASQNQPRVEIETHQAMKARCSQLRVGVLGCEGHRQQGCTLQRQAWGWLCGAVFPSLEEVVTTTEARLGKQLGDDQHHSPHRTALRNALVCYYEYKNFGQKILALLPDRSLAAELIRY